MKKLLIAAAALIALAAPVFAQSSFSDVPADHWAYDAVSELESLGMLIGYPDGTFAGKRTMTRYEFAVVLARLLPFLGEDSEINIDGFAKRSDLGDYLSRKNYKAPEEADLSGLATIEGVNRLQALVDEFQPELAALGVDVNVHKASIAGLKDRVAALEDEQERIKISGKATFMAKTTFGDDNLMDWDWNLNKKGERNVGFLKDVQIDIKGKVNNKLNVFSTLVMGDYLKKSFADNKTDVWSTASDIVPFYMYAASSDEKWGDVRVGRMPFQLNAYLYKRPHTDSYFDIERMYNGDYSTEGIDYFKSFGSIDLRAFAVRPVYDWNDSSLFTENLSGKISAIGGAELGFNWKNARLSGLYSSFSTAAGNFNRRAVYYGGSLYVPMGQFYANGDYYKVKTKDNTLTIPDSGAIWNAKLGFDNSKLNAAINYMSVDPGYDAPGYWDAYGFIGNPTNIKGWKGSIGYNFTDSFNLYGTYRNYKARDLSGSSLCDGTKDIVAGIKWNLTAKDLLSLEYNQCKAAKGDLKSDYYTAEWTRKIGKTADFKLMYQYIKNDYEKYGKDNTKGSLVTAMYELSF